MFSEKKYQFEDRKKNCLHGILGFILGRIIKKLPGVTLNTLNILTQF